MKVFKFLLSGLLVLSVLVVGLPVWGLIEPYFIDTEEHVAEIPNLPAAWEGELVGVVADWQIGMWLDNTPTVRRSVDRLVEERPAAVLLAGDFVYGPSKEWDEDLRKVRQFVRPLAEAGIPTYAVLGNHDYRMSKMDGNPNFQAAQRVRSTLRASGILVLKNEAVLLEEPSDDGRSSQTADGAGRLYLVGIGAHWPEQDRPKKALSGVPEGAPRLVMMHHPDTFALLPPRSAPLAVAGHTHGGQLRLPATPAWTWMTYAKQDKVHADGWIEGYGRTSNRLYVNRGIGFSVAPLRINSTPEVTLFTLRAT